METASGQQAADENFPVASWLIAPEYRPAIQAYYAFAREIDDIADSPILDADTKVARLDAFDQVFDDPRVEAPDLTSAVQLRDILHGRGLPMAHARDLIVAFKQDASKARYADWGELLHYCRYSAEPVGRFLLDLHGEDRTLWPYADALCTALQIINHLQDCGDDYRNLNRVYIPETWFEAEGEDVSALKRGAASPEVRRVLDRCLAGVEELLAPASTLPARLQDPRLAMETAAICELAQTLTKALYRQDPLVRRVRLSTTRKALIAAFGAFRFAVHRRWERGRDTSADALKGEPFA